MKTLQKRERMFKPALSVILVSCLLGHLDCKDINQVTVKRGESATLECNVSTGAAVLMLRWRNHGLQSENENKQLYVFYIRDGITHNNYQHPSFRGRVQLRDPQMKDGDLSVIIRNVSMDDSGVYECFVGYDRGEPQLIKNTNLTVEEAGEPGQRGGQRGDEGKKDGGSAGLIVGLSVPAVLIVAAVGFIIYRKHRKQSDPDYQPPADQGLQKLPAASQLNCDPAAVPGSQYSEEQEL